MARRCSSRLGDGRSSEESRDDGEVLHGSRKVVFEERSGSDTNESGVM